MNHLLKSAFVVVVCLVSLVLSTDENVYPKGSYVSAYGNILKALRLNHSLAYQNLNTLLKRLELHDCSNGAGHQHKCVTVDSLFQINNISTQNVLDEKEFAMFSSVIVFALLPRDNTQRYITEYVDAYHEILERYATSGLCERILDKLLRDINKSNGKHLKKEKCFSSGDILQELSLSNQLEITKSSLPLISMSIISKLLNEQCIKVGEESPLPCPSYFLKKLFMKYATNGTINKDEMRDLLKNLRIGKDRLLDVVAKRRRRYIFPQTSPTDALALRVDHNIRLFRRALSNAEEDMHEKCYSVDELFLIYNVDDERGLTLNSFLRFLPALLEQIERNACHAVVNDVQNRNVPKDENVPRISVWGYAFAAVSVVSLCSLVMIIPLMKTKFYEKSLVFLVSLAVGTLVGDALLHLLPHATGFHSHGSDEFTSYKNKSYLWKFLSVLGGVYGLFFFETSTHAVLRLIHAKKITAREEVITDEKFQDGRDLAQKDNKVMEPAIAPMAWTVIIGDTLHNIADGIAIGVAFSDSIIGGLSTSIAVLCHEVPHELGDFVVLLSAGMNVRQALLANFLSACFCFLGLILGKSIGEIEDYNLWILGITAGFFLYIALTNKLPELMHVSEDSELPTPVIFVLQQAGIILGFLGMFLLAYFKKDIDL